MAELADPVGHGADMNVDLGHTDPNSDPYKNNQIREKGQLTGVLAPHVVKRPKGKHQWLCEVCGARNFSDNTSCVSCRRARDPEWLTTGDGTAIQLGMMVEVVAAEAQSKYAQMHMVTTLKLTVLAAFDLAQADLSGKSDPYCIVYFNDVKIGQTAAIENDHDPVWIDEHFLVPLPLDTSSAVLKVEVRDHDAAEDPNNIGDFLGQVLICGPDLAKLPKKNARYPLQKSPNKKINAHVKGDIMLHFEMLQSGQPCDTLGIQVVEADDLANADETGHSDPYVRLLFNGIQVSRRWNYF
jgi:hypothetical protein